MTDRELRRYARRGWAPVVCPETGREIDVVATKASKPKRREPRWWPTSMRPLMEGTK